MKTLTAGFSHHGVEAVGKVPSQPGRGGVFTAKLFDLLLGLMEHLHTLGVSVGQLIQLQHAEKHTQTTGYLEHFASLPEKEFNRKTCLSPLCIKTGHVSFYLSKRVATSAVSCL